MGPEVQSVLHVPFRVLVLYTFVMILVQQQQQQKVYGDIQTRFCLFPTFVSGHRLAGIRSTHWFSGTPHVDPSWCRVKGKDGSGANLWYSFREHDVKRRWGINLLRDRWVETGSL